MKKAGIYIHIPFCIKKCAYCDFYSVAYDEHTANNYVDALINELSLFERREIDTIYFGGGTPSLLASEQVSRILSAINDRMAVCDGAELTLEANPATANRQKLSELRSVGINRLSVGIQSTDEQALKALGRLHTKNDAFSFIDDARSVGFDNISADIMLALPKDSREKTIKTVKEISSLPLRHISAYLLKIMENTPFYQSTPEGIPCDDEQAALYELCCETLEEKGFKQYEISNFAKAGYESRHNLKYWNCEDYIGLGAAAHSCLDGKRYSFARNITKFVDLFDGKTEFDEQAALRMLDAEGVVDAEDYIMLRLRTTYGLSLGKLYDLYSFQFEEKKIKYVESCASSGLLNFDGNDIRLTRRGFLVSNSIISSLI